MPYEVVMTRDSSGIRTVVHKTPEDVIEELRGPKGDKGDPGMTPDEIRATVAAYMAENPTGVPGLYTGYGPPGTIVGAVVGSSYIDLDTMTIHKLGA